MKGAKKERSDPGLTLLFAIFAPFAFFA